MLDEMDYAIRIVLGLIIAFIVGAIIFFVVQSTKTNELGNAEESLEYINTTNKKNGNTSSNSSMYETYTPGYKYTVPKRYNSKDDGSMSIQSLIEEYQKDAKIDVSVNQDRESNMTVVTVTMEYDDYEVERFTDSTVIKSKSNQTYSMLTKDVTDPKEVTFYMEGLLDPDDVLVGVGSSVSKSYCYYNNNNEYVDYDYPEDKLIEQRIAEFEKEHGIVTNTPVREDYLTGNTNDIDYTIDLENQAN